MTDILNKISREHKLKLRSIGDAAQLAFERIHSARERAFGMSRGVVRQSANCIRATHRGEFNKAKQILDDVKVLVTEMGAVVKDYPAVYYAGFIEDAQKEYVEASVTLALAEATPILGPEELNVGCAPYLNGLSEVVGELRRYILDSLRKDDSTRCEELLSLMDEIYNVLVSMDFPEAVTRGLRRSTDVARGLLERTRADLTVALREKRLELKIDSILNSGI